MGQFLFPQGFAARSPSIQTHRLAYFTSVQIGEAAIFWEGLHNVRWVRLNRRCFKANRVYRCWLLLLSKIKPRHDSWSDTKKSGSNIRFSVILDLDLGYEYRNKYSNKYSITSCCDLLLSDTAPKSAIVFIHRYQKGKAGRHARDVLLATELARIYYTLSKQQREELGLYADWIHVLGWLRFKLRKAYYSWGWI